MVKRRQFMHIDVIRFLPPIEPGLRPQFLLKVVLAQIKRIIVTPFSMDEPTKASWYISVTADSNRICTVMAIRPPSLLRYSSLPLG